MENLPLLSDGEFDILECVWNSPKELTQTEIARSVNERTGKDLKVVTVSTYIKRIMWKGYLNKNVKDGSRFPTYSAAVSREEYFVRAAENFIKRWGKEAVKEMMAICDREER